MPSDLNGIFMPVHLTHSILETQFIYTSHLGLPQISTNSVFTYLFHFTKLLDVQAGFRKGRGSRDQIANINWIIEKVRKFQKNIYFYFIDYAKAFDCVDYNKLWKILKQWEFQTT